VAVSVGQGPPAEQQEAAGQPPVDWADPATLAELNRQTSVLQNVLFASQARASLSLDGTASISSFRVFFARFWSEAGSPRDPVEKLLLEQLAVAHLKVGELYALAAAVKALEFKQLYGNAAVRLLGMVCQLVGTLATYRNAARPRRQPRRPATTAKRASAAKPAAAGAGTKKPDTKVRSKPRGTRR
jgi:hypothetical protein